MSAWDLRDQSVATTQWLVVIGASTMAFSLLSGLLVLFVIPGGLGYLSGLAFITLSVTFLLGSASLLTGKLVEFIKARKA